MAKQNKHIENLLDFIPIHKVDWVKQEDGTVCLQKPKIRSAWLLRFIRKFGFTTHFQIHLDDFGTFVWERCDGKSRILDIAESLKIEFGERVEPVYDRLGAFFRALTYEKLIRYQRPTDSQA